MTRIPAVIDTEESGAVRRVSFEMKIEREFRLFCEKFVRCRQFLENRRRVFREYAIPVLSEQTKYRRRTPGERNFA